jgi:hypothetical protein
VETLCHYVVQCRMFNVPFFPKYRRSCSGARIDSLSLSEIDRMFASTRFCLYVCVFRYVKKHIWILACKQHIAQWNVCIGNRKQNCSCNSNHVTFSLRESYS